MAKRAKAAKSTEKKTAKRSTSTRSRKKGSQRADTLADLPSTGVLRWLPSGFVLIDNLTEGHGLPMGKITTVWGAPNCGKTTLCYHLMRQMQVLGGEVHYCEAEDKLNPARAKHLGVKLRLVNLHQFCALEEMFGILIDLCKKRIKNDTTSKPIFYVVDSHSALAAKAEKEAKSDATRTEPGLSARVTSFKLRILSDLLGPANITVLMVSQLKEKIGGGGRWGGSPKTMIAEHALRFHSSVILRFRGSWNHTEGGQVIGRMSRMVCERNNFGEAWREAQVLVGADGFDESRALLELAIENGLVSASGSWFELEGEDEGKFRASQFSEILSERKDLLDELRTICAMGEFVAGPPPAEPSMEEPSDGKEEEPKEKPKRKAAKTAAKRKTAKKA